MLVIFVFVEEYFIKVIYLSAVMLHRQLSFNVVKLVHIDVQSHDLW